MQTITTTTSNPLTTAPIELYTRVNCFYCREAKKLLREKDTPFQEIIIDHDITRDEVIAKFPDRKTLPIVVIEGQPIGGYTELLSKFQQQQTP